MVYWSVSGPHNLTPINGAYSLPKASSSTVGGIKVGSGLNIDVGGTLSTSSTLALDTINENTTNNGVTIDSVLLKDGGVTLTNTLLVDTIEETVSGNGVTIDSVVLKDGGVTLTNSLFVDTIQENTSTNGVTIDYVLLKDGNITSSSGHVNVHKVTAQNYDVGSKNIISASGQVSCIDLEVKKSR